LPWPRSTMDSIRASEAPDAGSIPAEATKNLLSGLVFLSQGLIHLPLMPG
jgi:hypothetical protein